MKKSKHAKSSKHVHSGKHARQLMRERQIDVVAKHPTPPPVKGQG